MSILEKIKNIISELEAAEYPYKKEINKNNDKLGKLQIKKNKLLEEINSNIRPAIKAVKKRELDELVNEIGILTEDTNYLKAQMETDSNISNLINELIYCRSELNKEKERIIKDESNIRERYKNIMDKEIAELWASEKEFNEAREVFIQAGTKYQFGLAFSQI